VKLTAVSLRMICKWTQAYDNIQQTIEQYFKVWVAVT